MKGQEVYLILNNIRSAYNVGSIFRTADAAGVNKIYVCGYSPTPTDKKVAKTSLGAEESVPWEYYKQTWRLLEKLKNPPSPRLRKSKRGVQIVALERFDKLTASKLGVRNIFKFKPKFPMALILGNEVLGLSPKILKYCDQIIEIPMYGKKESLNVAIAAGIAIYKLLEKK